MVLCLLAPHPKRINDTTVRQYPAFLQLRDRKCLIVGDDPNTDRQVESLLSCGARVVWIKPAGAAVAAHGNDRITTHLRDWCEADLEDCWLAIANSEDPQLNAAIATACETRRVLCHVRSQPEISSFAIPAVVDRSPLLVAINSGGVSPILSRVLKSKIETLIPAAYANLAKAVGRHRKRVSDKLPRISDRSHFWHALINGPTGELAFNAEANTLDTAIAQAVDAIGTNTTTTGHVSLVGAGPGDPDLLTFRALRLVQSADVVVYDRLVSPEILKLCRADAQMIYAGKARANHAIEQGSINQLLVDLAAAGQNVVRLKGGDPFIFGRGGEEIETLAHQNIGFQVVPGITAAAGCAAFGGIPLTHRDHAQSCVFVTGHLRNGEVNMNWQDLQDPTQTIVVYMGLVGLKTICESLMDNGRAAATPAALIEQGTTQSQRVLCGTLETLPEVVQKAAVNPPTLLIIGSVVTLRDKLAWFHPAQISTAPV